MIDTTFAPVAYAFLAFAAVAFGVAVAGIVVALRELRSTSTTPVLATVTGSGCDFSRAA